eukprot:13924309-Alexandrium_andersonii.AAC.1
MATPCSKVGVCIRAPPGGRQKASYLLRPSSHFNCQTSHRAPGQDKRNRATLQNVDRRSMDWGE